MITVKTNNFKCEFCDKVFFTTSDCILCEREHYASYGKVLEKEAKFKIIQNTYLNKISKIKDISELKIFITKFFPKILKLLFKINNAKVTVCKFKNFKVSKSSVNSGTYPKQFQLYRDAKELHKFRGKTYPSFTGELELVFESQDFIHHSFSIGKVLEYLHMFTYTSTSSINENIKVKSKSNLILFKSDFENLNLNKEI